MPRRSRFFGHGELHLVVLALLDRQAMHGYELLGELARLFGPAYRPSPGGLYPALEALEQTQLIVGSEHAGRRVYAVTDQGSEALLRRQHLVAAIEARTGVRLQRTADVQLALDRFAARVLQLAPRIDVAELDAALEAATRRLEARAAHTPAAHAADHHDEERTT